MHGSWVREQERILALVSAGLPEVKRPLVSENRPLLIELLRLLNEDLPPTSPREPNAHVDFLLSLLNDASSIREKLYEEGLLIEFLNDKEENRVQLAALELSVLSRDFKTRLYNNVIQIMQQVEKAKEVQASHSNLSVKEKKKAKIKLDSDKFVLEKILGDEENYSIRITKIAEKYQVQREITSLKEEIAYIDRRIHELDHPLALTTAEYLKELYAYPGEFADLIKSGFCLAVFLARQDEASQKFIMSLFSKEWLKANLGTVFDLSKLLGHLLPENQRELLRKIDLRTYLKTNDFTLVLSAVANKAELEGFLREELSRQVAVPQPADHLPPLVALPSRASKPLLFQGAHEEQRRLLGASVEAGTLSRIIRNADKQKPVNEDDSNPLLPHQVKRTPSKK